MIYWGSCVLGIDFFEGNIIDLSSGVHTLSDFVCSTNDLESSLEFSCQDLNSAHECPGDRTRTVFRMEGDLRRLTGTGGVGAQSGRSGQEHRGGHWERTG